MKPFEELQPHQQRVVSERTELLAKTEKLGMFTGSGTYFSLPHDEQRRLTRQLAYMQLYVNVLQERIEAF